MEDRTVYVDQAAKQVAEILGRHINRADRVRLAREEADRLQPSIETNVAELNPESQRTEAALVRPDLRVTVYAAEERLEHLAFTGANRNVPPTRRKIAVRRYQPDRVCHLGRPPPYRILALAVRPARLPAMGLRHPRDARIRRCGKAFRPALSHARNVSCADLS